MRASVKLQNGFLPDRFGKYAPADHLLDGHPCVSFPIELDDVPAKSVSLALTFLDWDAIPVGGFCWIHWIACNIPAETRLIPEDASRSAAIPCIQGSNSNWSKLAGGSRDPRVIHRYTGPWPPDRVHCYTLTVYALDCELPLADGYYLNEFRRHARGHVLTETTLELPSRA